jgi:hypothetical protein
MKKFAIRIKNGQPVSVVIPENGVVLSQDLDMLEHFVPCPPHAESVRVAAFRQGWEGYRHEDATYRLWLFANGRQFYREMMHDLSEVAALHAQISQALERAQNAVDAFLATVVPDGDYTVESGVTKL